MENPHETPWTEIAVRHMVDDGFRMHPEMKLGPVSLRVKDLDKVLSFYVQDMGLKVLRRSGSLNGEIVELGANDQSSEPLLLLRHDSNASARPRNAAGLYHYAILLPDRRHLAGAYVSLGSAGVLFDGFSDHLVSEALYLTDREGNGIEIYSDRPRGRWSFDERGRIRMATKPLDMDSLLLEMSTPRRGADGPIFQGAKIGHFHLKVTNITRSRDFYHGLLGFDLMSDWGSAAFLSVGGYHHHIGLNSWESLGGLPCSDEWSGLDHLTMSIPDRDFLDRLNSRLSGAQVPVEKLGSGRFMIRDPDGIKWVISLRVPVS